MHVQLGNVVSATACPSTCLATSSEWCKTERASSATNYVVVEVMNRTTSLCDLQQNFNKNERNSINVGSLRRPSDLKVKTSRKLSRGSLSRAHCVLTVPVSAYMCRFMRHWQDTGGLSCDGMTVHPETGNTPSRFMSRPVSRRFPLTFSWWLIMTHAL